MRVAAIDLGTNATRLLVADVEDDGVDEVVRRTRITRLGEGVDARRLPAAAPVARVRNVLVDYRREAAELGAERTLAVATSAVRDAENGEAFLGEVEWSYGFATRLLTGDEEAAMTLRGVGPLEPGTVVVDVGGGSTELITETSGRASTSARCGSPSATAATGTPPPRRSARTCRALARRAGARRRRDDRRARGARRGHARRHRPRCSAGSAPRPTRSAGHACSQPDRSDVIAAGVLIVREVLLHLGVDRIAPSTRDLLNGVALEAAALPEPTEGRGAARGLYLLLN